MELHELKLAWQEMDRKLDATMALQLDLQKDIRVDRARKSIRRFIGLPVSELIVGLISAVTAGTFLVNNFDQATLFGSVPALLILVLGILTVVLSVWQLELIGNLDYAGPVTDSQRRLAKITQIRIKSAVSLIAISIPIWFVFPIFALQLVIGRPGYLAFSQKLGEMFTSLWLVGNILVGIAVVAGTYLVFRWKGSRIKWSKVLVEDSLASAAAQLAEIDQFEKER